MSLLRSGSALGGTPPRRFRAPRGQVYCFKCKTIRRASSGFRYELPEWIRKSRLNTWCVGCIEGADLEAEYQGYRKALRLERIDPAGAKRLLDALDS